MAHPAPETLHAAFRAALLAFAYPGRPRRAPAEAGAGAAERNARLVIAAAFDDGADPEGEGYVFVPPNVPPAALVATAPRGSEEAPQDGATIVVAAAGDPARTRVRLSGPGIDGVLETLLPLDRDTLAERALACCEPPRGVDLLVSCDDGTLVGLPRSTALEVVG
ncbi:MAG: phosphonate C-P lyase system protein PhnH [Candidatus Baltobacteraceae bacterium]|jgi:alpha-D-ribose 1-methylphosphonate 5-triphosphate synthase subunit PhnH